MTAAGPGEASPQRARRFCAMFADPAAKGAAHGGRGAFAGGKIASRSVRGRFCVATFADPAAKGAAHGGRGAFAGGKNASAACGGIFARQRSQGRAAKGAVRGGRALSGRKNTSAAARGRFCAAMFAGPGGKGRCPRRSSALWAKNTSRSSAGAFLCGNVRRAGLQRALFAVVGAFSGRKDTSAAARGRFCAAMFAGPDGKGRCPRRSGRSPSSKNVPHSARERLSRLVWPYGGAKRPAAPGLTSGGALAPLRPPPFPHPPQRAGPDASPPGARACTGPRRRRRPTGGRRTSGGCRNDSA